MRIAGERIEDADDLFTDLLTSMESGVVKAYEPGEVKEVVAGASQELDLDAVSLFIEHVIRIEQFIHMAPVAKQVGEIIMHKEFKQEVNNRSDGLGADLLKKWLKDCVRGYVPEESGGFAQAVRFLRRNGMVFALAGNIPSIMRQGVSMFNAMGVHPVVGAKIAQYNSICAAHPMTAFKEIAAIVYDKSDMMVNRNFDREIASMSREKGARRRLLHKKDWNEIALTPQRISDRYTTVVSWKGLYDAALNSEAVQVQFELDGSEKAAIEFADKGVSRTQAMGDVEYLPGFFRGGTIEKLITTFMNEPNNALNFWGHDIAGALKAGKITKSMAAYKILFSLVIPALVFGLLRRARLPETWGEAMFDQAALPISAHLFLGDIAMASVMGFSGARTGVEDIALSEAGKAIQSISKGSFKAGVWHGAKAAGAVTGKIPAQAFRTAEGIKDIATGETKDLRRLIYSKWSLEAHGPGSKKEEKGTGTGRGAPGRSGVSGGRGAPGRG
jgi:hypothetical protein